MMIIGGNQVSTTRAETTINNPQDCYIPYMLCMASQLRSSLNLYFNYPEFVFQFNAKY